MASIHLDLPDGVLLASGQSPDEFASEAKFLLALKLFEMDRLSSGKAAELCDLPRVEFLSRASRMKVAVADLDREELDRELMDA
jgi:predicted HTH domain antitoxin